MSSACGTSCGVTRERSRQQAAARALAERAYPGLVYTEFPAWMPDEAPVSRDELSALGSALIEVLPTRALAMGDAVYLYAGLAAPSWLEVLLVSSRKRPLAPRDETHLRVLFSPLGRYYTLQEIRLSPVPEPGGVWIAEQRRCGVEDKRLQLFVKATQGYLRTRRIVGLDAAFLSEPLPDPSGAVAAQLGASPTLWTLLFERTPAMLVGGAFVADPVRRQRVPERRETPHSGAPRRPESQR